MGRESVLGLGKTRYKWAADAEKGVSGRKQPLAMFGMPSILMMAPDRVEARPWTLGGGSGVVVRNVVGRRTPAQVRPEPLERGDKCVPLS